MTSSNPNLPRVFTGLVGIWQRGFITFNYPDDWYVSDSIFLGFSNIPSQIVNTTPVSGQFIAYFVGVSETIATVDLQALSDQCTNVLSHWTAETVVTEIFNKITETQLDQLKQQGFELTQPEKKTVNGIPMVYYRQYQDNMESLMIYVDLGNGIIPSFGVIANKGELS